MNRIKIGKILATFLILTMITPLFNASNDLNWSFETVDYEGFVGRYTAIAIDSNDCPHISYFDVDNGDLKYAYWNGKQWITETVDSQGIVGMPTAIALDSKEHPHIAYHDFFKKTLKYAYYDGSKWHIETIAEEEKLFGHLAITLDENDYPHIACCGYSNKDLKYAYYDGSKWHIETVDSEGRVDWFSIATGSIILKDGKPHILYGNENKLKHAYYDGSKWHIETIDIGDGELCYVSTEMDSKGYFHISYFDSGSNDTKYAYYDGSKWHIETVLQHTATEIFVAEGLALDSNDYPHIAYYRYTEIGGRDQGYAYYDGSKWHTEIIESEGYIGGCCDIAIDSNDNPVISYCYFDLGDLKCARKTTNNPPEKPSRPHGLIWGKVGWNLTYITSSTDKDGDQLYYMFDWGDGNVSGWLGPYKPGEMLKAKHSWRKEGTYIVRVKARDIHYSESPWSDPLIVSVPFWKIINELLLRLFRAPIFNFDFLTMMLPFFTTFPLLCIL